MTPLVAGPLRGYCLYFVVSHTFCCLHFLLSLPLSGIVDSGRHAEGRRPKGAVAAKPGYAVSNVEKASLSVSGPAKWHDAPATD